ncbi:uncharacterized protein LOC129347317 isoform X1 [Amphiprion ocellaris]|uniref:uncharacterized protein LOC129347317 isoform X1 n=1 Tax=Amphiprion ocellaris TaxID=80972 RepID=UPI00241150F0|nr:uncharacterized protein LOC129347317 isoform X1 [Amphiprion ocellaris]
MEGLVLKIKQQKIELYRAIDNDKDRKPKRELNAKEKQKLEEAIAVYNNLVPETEAVDTADAVLSRDFPSWPWDSASTVPLETKKVVYDKVMLLSRLREEDGILIREMKNHCRCLMGSSKGLKREIQQIEKDLCEHSGYPMDNSSHHYLILVGCPFKMSLEAYEGLKVKLKKKLQEMKKNMEEAFGTYRKVLMDPTALVEEEEEEEEEVEEEEEEEG